MIMRVNITLRYAFKLTFSHDLIYISIQTKNQKIGGHWYSRRRSGFCDRDLWLDVSPIFHSCNTHTIQCRDFSPSALALVPRPDEGRFHLHRGHLWHPEAVCHHIQVRRRHRAVDTQHPFIILVHQRDQWGIEWDCPNAAGIQQHCQVCRPGRGRAQGRPGCLLGTMALRHRRISRTQKKNSRKWNGKSSRFILCFVGCLFWSLFLIFFSLNLIKISFHILPPPVDGVEWNELHRTASGLSFALTKPKDYQICGAFRSKLYMSDTRVKGWPDEPCRPKSCGLQSSQSRWRPAPLTCLQFQIQPTKSWNHQVELFMHWSGRVHLCWGGWCLNPLGGKYFIAERKAKDEHYCQASVKYIRRHEVWIQKSRSRIRIEIQSNLFNGDPRNGVENRGRGGEEQVGDVEKNEAEIGVGVGDCSEDQMSA